MLNRIYLTKREKKVLLAVMDGVCNGADKNPYEEPIVRAVTKSLGEKGLIIPICTKGGSSGRLTDAGILYLADNPKLRNPFDWKTLHDWINTVIALAALMRTLLC